MVKIRFDVHRTQGISYFVFLIQDTKHNICGANRNNSPVDTFYYFR